MVKYWHWQIMIEANILVQGVGGIRLVPYAMGTYVFFYFFFRQDHHSPHLAALSTKGTNSSMLWETPLQHLVPKELSAVFIFWDQTLFLMKNLKKKEKNRFIYTIN